MTKRLAKLLAETDDPAVIEELLQFANSDQAPENSPKSQDTTLQELYERFLSRRQDRSPTTRAQYKRTIPRFVQFAEKHGISKPSAISIEVVDRYVDELQEEYDTDATIHTYTKNTRAWLRWLNKRGVCDDDIYGLLDKEELGLTPKARDEALPEGQATQVLENLRQKRSGSEIHAVTELLWNAGPRIGGVYSADLSDFVPEMQELRLRHRPESGTRLKNGYQEDNTPGDGERNVELSNDVIEAIQLYIQTTRPEVTDEYGRKPLFATKYGRASRSTLRRWVYRATSCRWLSTDNTEPSCDRTCDPDSDVCPHSYYPHAIRRGSIVCHLSGGLRSDLASERFDVSTKIIRKHYDPRTKRQRKEDRSQSVRDAWSG